MGRSNVNSAYLQKRKKILKFCSGNRKHWSSNVNRAIFQSEGRQAQLNRGELRSWRGSRPNHAHGGKGILSCPSARAHSVSTAAATTTAARLPIAINPNYATVTIVNEFLNGRASGSGERTGIKAIHTSDHVSAPWLLWRPRTRGVSRGARPLDPKTTTGRGRTD